MGDLKLNRFLKIYAQTLHLWWAYFILTKWQWRDLSFTIEPLVSDLYKNDTNEHLGTGVVWAPTEAADMQGYIQSSEESLHCTDEQFEAQHARSQVQGYTIHQRRSQLTNQVHFLSCECPNSRPTFESVREKGPTLSLHGRND